MAAETAELRTKTRRVKDHILSRFLRLADKVDSDKPLDHMEKEIYDSLMLTFARNVLPRSQEIGGDPDDTTPIPILTMNVPTHNGHNQDSQPSETNTGSTGRNLSE